MLKSPNSASVGSKEKIVGDQQGSLRFELATYSAVQLFSCSPIHRVNSLH